MPQVLLGLFTRDDQVVGMGIWLLRLLGAIQIFDALYWVCSGVLKGAGDTRWILVVSGIYNWLVFLPLAFVLGVALGWGVFGAWVGFAVMVLLQGGTFWWRFHQGRWQALSILSPDHGA
jgi:Na+-driven multidrug efflux pump